MLAVLIVLLAGCGITKAPAQPVTTLKQSSTMTTSVSGGTSATATLEHVPTGNATLNWNASDQMLTVQVKLTGLAPHSTHPEHIHQGKCDQNGKILYSLMNLVADAHGVASETTKISVPGGIPASGWSINIHNGPGLENNDQSLPLVCGNITNQDTSLKNNQLSQVMLTSSPGAIDQEARGEAHLSISNQTLTVQLSLTGLFPHSSHAAHIHEGACASQGPVLYTLPVIKADATGKATITATFPNVVTIPATGWYVHVHHGKDLSTQTGFDPIACGNIMLNR